MNKYIWYLICSTVCILVVLSWTPPKHCVHFEVDKDNNNVCVEYK